MQRGRRKSDNEELTALLRLTQLGVPLYEGEIKPGHKVELADGLRLEVLWIRVHTPPRSSVPPAKK